MYKSWLEPITEVTLLNVFCLKVHWYSTR